MAKQVVLWKRKGASLVSSWTDYIYCTQRADGTFSLRQTSAEEGDGIISPKGVTGIRSAEKIVDTVLEMSDSIGPDEISGEICSTLEVLDRGLAKKCREYGDSPSS